MGCFVVAPVTASERDLRALAAIVSEDRPDLPDGEGLPPSLLADLIDQIRCDQVVFLGFDGSRQESFKECGPSESGGRLAADLRMPSPR